MKELLVSLGKKMGVKITPAQAEQFQLYLEMLLEWNEKLNLTAITEPEEIVEKHFLDSLSPLLYCPIKEGARLIDVGTGAGFPGVPLKILRPDLELLLLDGTNKRLVFLRELCGKLGINAQLLHRRAEEAGRDVKLRETCDVAVARAVAPLNVLAEYCLPLVKMGGYFLALKGPGGQEELAGAQRALELLGGCRTRLHGFALPCGDQRSIVEARKLQFTPKDYPRHGNTIVKHPL